VAFCPGGLLSGIQKNLGVPDVILPTDLGYLALALHVESHQTSFIGSEYSRTEENSRQIYCIN